MRISSSTLYDSNVLMLGQQQAQLVQTQQQIASGKRMINAASDPVAATRALDIKQAVAINTQQTANRGAARDSISLAESTLQSVTSLIQAAKTTAVYAGNGTLNSSDRAKLATDLNGRLKELIGLSNSTDSAGNYMFSGFQSKTPPFSTTGSGVVSYNGDGGQRLVQVSQGRQMAASNNGANIFMRIKNGNGSFVTQAGTPTAVNSGSGIISAGSVTHPANLTGNSYSINFNTAAGATTYSVTNVTTGLPVMTAQPYVSGNTIAFDGVKFDIQGTPASGDRFTIQPSTNVSLFKTLSDLVTALKAPVVGSSLTSALQTGMTNLNNSLSTVLNTRASLGLRLNEIDALQVTGDNMSLQLKQTLSNLQDTNYTQAISNLTQQQTTLQAAQKSFVKISGLSMFSYM
ncbi:MAG: flagellar hook-associated protein FlgL [Gallionella sp.]